MEVVTTSKTDQVDQINSEQKENQQVRTVTYVKPVSGEPSALETTADMAATED